MFSLDKSNFRIKLLHAFPSKALETLQINIHVTKSLFCQFLQKNVKNALNVSESTSNSSTSTSSYDSNTRPTSPSSLGRNSPSVITLDSPSPPPAPASFAQPSSTTGYLDPPAAHSNSSSSYASYFNNGPAPSLPILELDSDSSGSHHSRNQGYN